MRPALVHLHVPRTHEIRVRACPLDLQYVALANITKDQQSETHTPLYYAAKSC